VDPALVESNVEVDSDAARAGQAKVQTGADGADGILLVSSD
jgi:hypothetical protein